MLTMKLAWPGPCTSVYFWLPGRGRAHMKLAWPGATKNLAKRMHSAACFVVANSPRQSSTGFSALVLQRTSLPGPFVRTTRSTKRSSHGHQNAKRLKDHLCVVANSLVPHPNQLRHQSPPLTRLESVTQPRLTLIAILYRTAATFNHLFVVELPDVTRKAKTVLPSLALASRAA